MNRENHWRLAQEDVWMYPLALLDLGIAIPPGCSQHMVAAPSDQGSDSAAAGSFPIEGPLEAPSPRCDVRNAFLLLRLVPVEEVNDSFPIQGCFINASFTAKRRDV